MSNISQFICGSSAAATPTQIAAREGGSSLTVIYTVPLGKTFKGHLINFTSTSNVYVNDIPVVSNYSGPIPVTLIAGTVVKALNSGGIVGIEE